jgi:BlaI family penicillinase repressor
MEKSLSRREREILDILFAEGEATTAQIRARMTEAPTGNAVRALVQIMEDKGVVVRKGKEGRELIFAPVEDPKRAGKRALSEVIETFYGGSAATALAAHFAKGSKLSPEEYERLKEWLDESQPGLKNRAKES